MVTGEKRYRDFSDFLNLHFDCKVQKYRYMQGLLALIGTGVLGSVVVLIATIRRSVLIIAIRGRVSLPSWKRG